MKHFLLLVFVLLLYTGCASSQPETTGVDAPTERVRQGAQRGGPFSGDPAERLERQMQALDERLSLTEEQELSIRAILEEGMQGQQDLRGQLRDPATRHVAMQTMQALRATTEAAIEAELTEDQIAAYRKMREEQRQRRGRREF